MQDLANRIAVVTGAGSGIGREVARFLAARGARVLAVDLNEDTVRNACADTAGGMSPCKRDVTEQDAPAQIMAACLAAFGTAPSILVNNAGAGNARSAHETSDEDWDRYIDINLRTVFRMSREAISRFGKAGGAIVNVASIFGLVGVQGCAPYSAAKAAIIGLTRQMAADYGSRNVRVNAIAPGLIATPATRERIAHSEQIHDVLIRGTPLGRVGTPLDVARAAAFLCSEEAAFITGQTLAVDGGWSTTRYRSQ